MPRCSPTILALLNAPAVVPSAPTTPAVLPAWFVFLRLTIPPPPVHLASFASVAGSTGRRIGADPAFATATISRIGG